MTTLTNTATPHDMVALYDRLAPTYDKLHRRWLRHAGAEAQVALEAVVRTVSTPETTLLDAGCGTGVFTRNLIRDGVSPKQMVLLDPSSAMLKRCKDLPAHRVQGRLEALPFHDAVFDVVTCAWALETAQDTEAALSELCRVVRPGGVLCLVFCAQSPARTPVAWLMRQAVLWRGSGAFLSQDRVRETIARTGEFQVRAIPNGGPAAALIARRFP